MSWAGYVNGALGDEPGELREESDQDFVRGFLESTGAMALEKIGDLFGQQSYHGIETATDGAGAVFLGIAAYDLANSVYKRHRASEMEKQLEEAESPEEYQAIADEYSI